MSIEYDRLPISDTIVTDTYIRIVTIEEAEEGRRHAAAIGDYVMAQRWLRLERRLAAQEDRVLTSAAHTGEGKTP